MLRYIPVLALCLGACASRAQPKAPPAPSGSAAASESASHEQVAVGAETPPMESAKTLRPRSAAGNAESSYWGVLDRAGLVGIVEQGLGRVLARVKVSPVLERGKFEGFRITAIDPAWAGAGVQVDDVVVRLNGQAIERPEQALVAFESLRVASELSLELVRAGNKIAVRYLIE